MISLQKLLVREKAGKEDNCGLYLISSNRKDPEMYEMVCSSSKSKKLWITSIRRAVECCPPEGTLYCQEHVAVVLCYVGRLLKLDCYVNKILILIEFGRFKENLTSF